MSINGGEADDDKHVHNVSGSGISSESEEYDFSPEERLMLFDILPSKDI